MKRAIELFDKAIPLANTELEMGHLYGLRDAAQVGQTTILHSLSLVTLSPYWFYSSKAQNTVFLLVDL